MFACVLVLELFFADIMVWLCILKFTKEM